MVTGISNNSRQDSKFKKIDLCIKDTNMLKVRKMAKLLNIDVIGCPYQEQNDKGIIYRINQRPSTTTDYRYLVVANDLEQLISTKFGSCKRFRKIKIIHQKREVPVKDRVRGPHIRYSISRGIQSWQVV